MIAALTAGSAVCCFGAAYMSHQFFPVVPVSDGDLIKNKSTLGTVNLVSPSELKEKTLKERIQAYTSGQANLQDVLLVTTEKPTLNQAYVVIAKKIEQLPPGSEERGQYEFLKKAADDHYSGFVPSSTPAQPTGASLLRSAVSGGRKGSTR